MLTRNVIEATALGAATLIDPQRLGRRTRPAYRVGVAAVTGIATHRALVQDDELVLNPVSRAAIALGTAGTIFGTMGLWERVDAVGHNWLVRRGVKHPRLALAGFAFVTSLVPALIDQRRAADTPDSDNLGETPRHEPLDPALRGVLRAILGATEEYGAPHLRTQLADATWESWEPPRAPEDPRPEYLQLSLNNPSAHQRARPLTFTFPIRARTVDGVEITIGVDQGLLDHVVVEGTLAAWPELAEVTLVSDDDVATDLP